MAMSSACSTDKRETPCPHFPEEVAEGREGGVEPQAVNKTAAANVRQWSDRAARMSPEGTICGLVIQVLNPCHSLISDLR